MRVLWFSPVPSLYEEWKNGGWVPSLERIVRKCCPDVELGIAFEHKDRIFKKEKNGVTYYPINKINGIKDKIRQRLFVGFFDWKMVEPYCKKVVENFKPDVIQCFGSEWPYALIANDVKSPVVVHMQGFMNVYNMSDELVASRADQRLALLRRPKALIQNWLCGRRFDFVRRNMERELMKSCKYFMGRTDWDKMLVDLYSPGSKYFYCAEAIRPEIYDAEKRWSFTESNSMKIVTITQANSLKGNEIILRTADLLKNQFGFDFSWRVAGYPGALFAAEKRCGIKHSNVNVELLGMIPAESVAEELRNAHVYVHPAIIDNSPNSLCEAQLIGCPVIATNVGGIPSLVKDGVSGILYPYAEPHVLAYKLMNIFDREKLENLSAKEIEVSHTRHNPQIIAEQLMKIYKELVNL